MALLSEDIYAFNRAETTDPAILDERESCRAISILEEHAVLDARFRRRAPRSGGTLDVVLDPGGEPCDLWDALLQHRRLVFASRASGRSAYAQLTARVARTGKGGLPALVALPVEIRALNGSRLDEAELARLSPPLGLSGVTRALGSGRAVVLADHLDAADDPAAMAESIVALAAKYPGAAFFVTVEKTAASSWNAGQGMPGFVSVCPAPRPAPPRRPPLAERPSARGRVLELAARAERALLRLAAAGPVLGAMSAACRRMIVCDIAIHLHAEHAIEFTRAELHDRLSDLLECSSFGFADGGIVLLPDRPSSRTKLRPTHLAGAVAEELLGSDLLTEVRPGVLALASFALQEYFAALRIQLEGTLYEVGQASEHSWWDEAIVLAAGMPRSPHTRLSAARLVRALLDANDSAVSRTLGLAVRCAAVAPVLPRALRNALALRLREAFPPGDDLRISHYAENIADIPVLALRASLARADADGRAGIAAILGQLEPPRELSLLVRLAADEEKTSGHRLTWIRVLDDDSVCGASVAFFALGALVNLASHSRAARSAYKKALAHGSLQAVQALRRVLDRELRDPDVWINLRRGERRRASELCNLAARALARRKRAAGG